MEYEDNIHGKDLSERLNETYNIYRKTSRFNRAPILKPWRKNLLDLTHNSLEDVKQYLTDYFSDCWKLTREKTTKKGTIFTFLSIPLPGSSASRNPGLYPSHYEHVLVRPGIQSVKPKK